MTDIELVVKMDEELWEKVKDGYVPLGISKYLKNGTPISDNATNGDVIMAMFSTVDTYFSNVIDMKLWWNAPYRKR